jgi:hypothetical protein
MSVVDFMIHLKPELSLVERNQLESEIADMDGVISVRFSPSHPHMLEVAYNPDSVCSDAVLECVRQRDGIAAQKVGL